MQNEHTLTDAYRRFGWGTRKLAELERKIGAYLASEPVEIARINLGGFINFVSIVRAPCPEEIYELTSGVLQDFRSALDYSVVQTVSRLAPGAKARPAFPSGKDADALSTNLRKQGWEQGAPDYAALLRNQKATPEGNTHLYALCTYNNQDKHNFIIEVSASQTSSFQMRDGRIGEARINIYEPWPEGGHIVSKISNDSQFNGQISFRPTMFFDGGLFELYSPVQVLKQISAEVEKVLDKTSSHIENTT